MKLKFTLLFIATAFAFSSNAQTAWVEDSVSMGAQVNPPAGASYPEDVFYSMKNGQQKATSNLNWHIGFQMTPPGPTGNVSIIANHAQTGMQVYSLHMSASSKFTSLVAADTVGLTSDQLYNADTSWNWGAFNKNTSGNIIDYGWGIYNQMDHNVYGDTLYLVKVGGEAYKVWPQMYVSTPADSVQYRMRIAKFDGSEDTTIRVYVKPNFQNRLFAYYDIENKVLIDREPNRDSWDVVFTRFIDWVPAPGGGPLVPYPVMGVLSNIGVKVADVRNVDPDTTMYQNYMEDKDADQIGSDWKNFNMSATPPRWEWDTTATFFVHSTHSMEIHQVVFTRFDGASTGKTVFKKRKVGDVVSVNDIENNISRYSIVPNPTTSKVNVLLDAKEYTDNAMIVVSDITGRVVMTNTVVLNKGLNALGFDMVSYPAGTYIITVAGEGWKVSDRMVVQH